MAPETRSSNDDAQVQAAAAAFASTWHGNITGMRSVHMAAVASEVSWQLLHCMSGGLVVCLQ
ncbi:hypothetical protein EON64_00905 [archaeon]|nr:MAG: hypothetical protein EON64_00905 [archaeon]